MNTGTVQIMWKEIIVGFIILYLLRRVLDVYMIKKYEKLLKLFGVIEMDTLKLEAEKHLKLCNFFSVGPWNKAIYWTYNGLCWLLATISYVEDDEYDLIEAGLLEELGDSKEFSYQVFANVALRAVFSGTVSITNTEIANTTVYTKDGKLIVKDGKVGCEVFVYDVLGQVVKSFIIENALETVQLGTTSSLYLVKIVDGADCIVKKVGNM